MINIVKFKEVKKGFLVGYFDAEVIPLGLRFNGCSAWKKDGKSWINFPSKQFQTKEGETRYQPIIEPTDPEDGKALLEDMRDALRAYLANGQAAGNSGGYRLLKSAVMEDAPPPKDSNQFDFNR